MTETCPRLFHPSRPREEKRLGKKLTLGLSVVVFVTMIPAGITVTKPLPTAKSFKEAPCLEK